MAEEQGKGYYDFDIDFDDIWSTSTLEEIFHLQDIRRRKLFLDTDIDEITVAPIVRHIMQFNAEDRGIPSGERRPILLYITCDGGSADSGFELIDVITASQTPVYTVNMGYAYSMGFLVFLAGAKRFAMPNAKFLMHDGSHLILNSGAKAEDQMEFHKKVEERIRDYVVSRSKISPEEYDGKRRMEWYLFADEAVEKGFADSIIGRDCAIGSVV